MCYWWCKDKMGEYANKHLNGLFEVPGSIVYLTVRNQVLISTPQTLCLYILKPLIFSWINLNLITKILD